MQQQAMQQAQEVGEAKPAEGAEEIKLDEVLAEGDGEVKKE